MSELMRAAAIDELGAADHLTAHMLPVPVPGESEVLVRVEAAGVQLTDAAIRGGWTPAGAGMEFPQSRGNGFSGTIVRVGTEVEGFGEGHEVVGFHVLGCYAAYVSAHTALERLDARPGETALSHGTAGGVGTIAENGHGRGRVALRIRSEAA